MKIYILDQLVQLIVGICIMLYILFKSHWLVVTVLLELIAIISFGYLCRRLILFPFDIINGKKTKIVCFGHQLGIEKYEVFRRKYCCHWCFYYERKRVNVVFPASLSKEEVLAIKIPERDKQVQITYYPYSKILCEWRIICD